MAYPGATACIYFVFLVVVELQTCWIYKQKGDRAGIKTLASAGILMENSLGFPISRSYCVLCLIICLFVCLLVGWFVR